MLRILLRGLNLKVFRSDIRIYLYTRSILHAKYVIIDGNGPQWEPNIDYLSLHKNREANMAFFSPDLVEILENHYKDDRLYCLAVDIDYCKNMPPINVCYQRFSVSIDNIYAHFIVKKILFSNLGYARY